MGRGRVGFEQGIARLSSYAREFGHTNPKTHEVWLSWRVGLWVSALRVKFRSGKLTDEQIVVAKEVGIRLSPPYRDPKPKPPTRAERNEIETLRRLTLLEGFFQDHRHINVPQVEGIQTWPGAGRWIARLRGHYRQGLLSQQVVCAAEAMGIDWNPGPGRRGR